jgi:hypothetical protein
MASVVVVVDRLVEDQHEADDEWSVAEVGPDPVNT